MDTLHWTESLKRELNYDPLEAAKYDNGVFWIDYKSILEFFDVFYLNWNPELFKYTDCTHQSWAAGTGPVKDTYNVGDNPQFRLTAEGGPGGADVWLLLTRHITQIQDFRDNKEYITLLVYKNDGRRVYYPYDPPPYIDGVRINSPHYLCKIRVGAARERYTLIVSQYEKTSLIHYTLRVYGTCPVTLTKLETYPFTRTISGEWAGIKAGGCANHPTHVNNPRIHLDISDGRVPCKLVLQLKGPRQYQLGIDVRVVSLEDPNLTAPFVSESSGNYRSGFVVMELQDLPAGRYLLSVSTFYPRQEGPFILEATCTRNITLTHTN
ncbi:Calpain-7 [Eumeta japonica]|uniref:Calpain-7 n=1 Tax=Eumeta variegata TaxID=151549 RepID=A0A4C1Y705_EUMVA|nr:Calpain-7 [Eumeta japonica]